MEKETEEKIRGSAKREIEDNSYLFEDQTEQVVSKRFRTCCKWYIRRANRYKGLYLSMTLIGGVCPILITALTGLDFTVCFPGIGKALVITLSVLASISVLILNVTRALDKWTDYRLSSEFLKRARTLYLFEKEYEMREEKELDQEFLQKIETFMAEENKEWAKANRKSSEENTDAEQKDEKKAEE